MAAPRGCAAGDKPAKVEDVMPIATGLEREELEAELQVRWLGSFWGATLGTPGLGSGDGF